MCVCVWLGIVFFFYPFLKNMFLRPTLKNDCLELPPGGFQTQGGREGFFFSNFKWLIIGKKKNLHIKKNSSFLAYKILSDGGISMKQEAIRTNKSYSGLIICSIYSHVPYMSSQNDCRNILFFSVRYILKRK